MGAKRPNARVARRHFLRALAAAGTGVALAPALAACGGTTPPANTAPAAPAPAPSPSPAAASAPAPSPAAPAAGSPVAVASASPSPAAVAAASPAAASSPAAAAMPAPLVVGSATPPTGDITIACSTEWGTLDFRKLADFNEWRVDTLVYSALVRNDDQFSPVPDLAERWEMPDDKTINFTLRQAKFQDGTDVTSADVKATFDAVLDPNFGAPNRPLFAAISSVEAPDPRRIVMRLSAPNPALMAFLPWIGIVPKHYAEQHPDQVATNPVGCGPFKFVSAIKQNQTNLEAFDGYWGGNPAFRRLIYRVVPEATTRTVEIQSGNVDMITEVSFSDVATLKQDSKLYVVAVPPNGFNYLGLNLQNPALADLRVRQAIAYAIDRDAINQAVYYGLATKATGPVIPSSWGYEPNVTTYSYDPTKAKSLLTEAGQAQGLKLQITSPNSQEMIQVGTILKQQLGAVGIQVDLTQLEQTVLVPQVVKGDIGDMLLGFGWGQQMDPLQHMYRQFYSENQPPKGYNFVHMVNADLDKALVGANTTTDRTQRKALLSQAQKILADQLPYVYLFNVPEFWAVNTRIAGVTAPAPMDRRFTDLAMKAQRKQ